MKKQLIALVVLLFSASLTAQAQYSYKPFRVDMGMGLSFAGTDGFGMGILIAVEPKYSVQQFSFGTRLELNGLFQSTNWNDNTDWDDNDYSTKLNASVLLTADYHITTGTFRPFVGAGLGAYFLAAAREDYDYYDYYNYYYDSDLDDYGTNFGVMLRAGFDVTHFRLALQYNIVGKASDVDNRFESLSFNYFAIAFSGYVGGKKIRR